MSEEIKILLVDDERKLLDSMSKRLKRRGHDVVTAQSGPDALEHMSREPFEVVVLDIKMPGMDGIETLGEIKRRYPDTEVLLLTGHASVTSGIEGVRLGAFDYLMKPIDFEVLVDKLDAAYEHRSKSLSKISRAELELDRWLVIEKNTVGEIMIRDFPRVLPDGHLQDAVESLGRREGELSLDEFYVVNETGALVGRISRQDILTAVAPVLEEEKIATGGDFSWKDLLEKGSGSAASWPISRVMRSEVVSLGEDSHVMEAAKYMIDKNLSQLPVAEGGKLVGIIRMFDVLVAISDTLAEAL